MTDPWLGISLALTSLIVATAHGEVLNATDERVVVVVVERAERCVPASPERAPRLPKSKGYVFLQLEVGGTVAQDPESLTGDRVLLRSGSSYWRPESVALGVPAGDPLGVRTRAPLLLFQVPRDTQHFSLKVHDAREVQVDV